MTAVTNFFNGIFIYSLKLIPVPNFSSLGWFSFSSVVNSFWQLLTADDSCHIFLWDLHLPPKTDTCAKFQLSMLIFIFISCQQLLTAVDSWWQLSQNFFWWDLHLPPKADTCAKFQLSRLIFIFISCQQLLTADDKCKFFFKMGSTSTP